MNVPCKDCPQRVLGRHDRCESYARYKRWREELRERALARHEMDNYEKDRIEAFRRRRNIG